MTAVLTGDDTAKTITLALGCGDCVGIGNVVDCAGLAGLYLCNTSMVDDDH